MFSNVITKVKRKQKKEKISNFSDNNLEKKKNNTIENIDDFVDNLISQINSNSSVKYARFITFLRIRHKLSTKKLLSITISVLLLFAVIASASSLIDSSSSPVDMVGIAAEDTLLFQNNQTENLLYNDNSTFRDNESLVNNESSEPNSNDTLLMDVDINASLNKTVFYVGLNLTLNCDKSIYNINETVVTEGTVSYNNSMINTYVNILRTSPSYNLSENLTILDGRFIYEFVPIESGSYIIQASISYLNESVEEGLVFDVLDEPVENISKNVSYLSVWDDSDYQIVFVGEQVTFFANYSGFNGSILNASCLISFNVGGWSSPVEMSYVNGFYIIHRSFSVAGSYQFRVSCSADGFETKSVIDSFVVSEAVTDVTEVSIVYPKSDENVHVLPGTSFYVERTINGPRGINAVFAPLFSDGLTVEKFEIIKHNTSNGRILEIVRDVTPQAFIASKGLSIVERRIDNLRENLPANVKQLNRVSYSESFNLDGPVTIRVWFKAPSWEDIISGSKPSSGKISYLTFANDESDGFDFESSTWWNSNWGKRKLITINSSQVAADLTNFPILVNITDTDLRDYAQNDGDDVAFVLYSDNTTKLNHEIELYNGSTGELFTWINVTSLSSSSDTKIWMYYNNSGSSNQQNPTGVWDSNYTGVWHLNDLVTDEVTSGTHVDSTVNGNNGSQNNNDDVLGLIGGAQDFDGDDYINIASTSSLQFTTGITLSGWIRLRTFGAGSDVDPILRKGEANPNNYQLMIDDNLPQFFLNGGDGDAIIGTTALIANTWYYIVGTWESGGSRIVYRNGVQDGTGTFTGPIPTDTRDLYIGGRAGTDSINGYLDEVRASNIVRNASWISTTYNTVTNTSTFISVGSEEYNTNTSVNTISPYNVTYSPYIITATGANGLDNVTLYYRYSIDNSSWGSNVSWNNNSNPDTESPWQWSFNFSNGTGYYEFYSIGNKSGFSDESAPSSADAICYFNESLNTPPDIALINPQPNGTIDVSPLPICKVWANDSDGDTLTVYWYENTTGSWFLRNTNNSISANSVVSYKFMEFSNYSTTYWWKVAINDSVDNTTAYFYFTTEPISTSVDFITPYNITTSPLTITATGDSVLDNVTLYYRWSQDNITWEMGSGNINWSSELLTNPGFETGDTTGWTNGGGGTMTVGTDCPWGTESPYEGTYYSYWLLAGENVNAYAYQNVSLDSYASYIDAGEAKINVTGWLVSDEYNVPVYDEFYMNVRFYNASNENMSGCWYESGGTNPISQGSGNNVDDWAIYGITNYTIPTETRKVQVSYFTWEYTPPSTWYDAGSADNFSIKVGIEDYNWTEFGTDSNYPWSWDFNFPNGTGYYEFYITGNKSGSPNETTPDNADAICKFNRQPTITNEGPNNGSTDISLTPQMNITVNDPDEDTMTITWYSNSSGTWQVFGTNSSVVNGTYHQINTNFSSTGKTYWWYVTVNDGLDTNTSATFYFTTTEAAPPQVTTNSSTGVEETNATLWGYLYDDGGESCTVRFEYGTTTSYGTNTTNQTKNTNDEFSAGISSLTPGQLYHYRAFANNTYGSDIGSDLTFLTKPQPPTSLTAQANNSATIFLTWIIGTGANNTYIERNTSSSWSRGEGTEIFNGTAALYEDSGLTQGTTYYYQAWSYSTWTDGLTLFQWSDNNASDSNTTNYRPTSTPINPANASTDVSLQPTCQIWANDTDGDTLTVYWYENSTSSWILRQTNTSVSANSTVNWTFTQASAYGITYWWKLAVNDTVDNISSVYHFTTESINTSVDPISPYLISTSPLTINVTGDSGLDKVTLWYRYSPNNFSWWNTNWSSRKPINLNVSSGTTPENYTVLLNISYDTIMQSDFNDLRFIRYSDNITELDFWIEDKSNGNWASVWIEIRNNITTTNQTHTWMYYGNPSAGSNSNGTATFEFFDDFPGTSLDTSTWSATGSYSVNDGITITTGSIYTDSTVASSPQNLTFEMKAYYSGSDASYSGLEIADAQSTSGGNGGANALAYHMTDSGGQDITLWGADGTVSSYNIVSGGSLTPNPTLNTDYIFGYSFYDSSQISYFYQNLEYSDIDRATYSGTWSDPFYLWLGYFTGSSAGGTNIDDITVSWVRIRKYTSSEPTYYIGEEAWMEWSDINNPDTSSPWSWSFNFPNGTGYYEFYSIGNKSGSVNETPPSFVDAICQYATTTINVTPSQWDVGTTTIGNYNYSTSNNYFNLTNNGTVILNIEIKASNATNETTGAYWNLSDTPGFNNYSLQYNKSGDVSWTNINLTYDSFVNSLGIGLWDTFDLNIFMATTSTKSDPMTLTVTFKSVVV